MSDEATGLLSGLASYSPSAWVLMGFAALCIGLSKAGFGGFGMLTVLTMAQVLPARASTGVVLPLLVLADVYAVRVFRRHARWGHLTQLFLPAALGVVGGFLLMPVIPEKKFAPLLGVIVLMMVGMQYYRRLRPEPPDGLHEDAGQRSRLFAVFIGVLSGLTTMLANAAGPVMTLDLLARRVPKMEFVGTAAVFFFLVNLFKVPFSASLGLICVDSLLLNLVLAPAVIAGVFAGRAMLEFVPQRLFEEILLIFAMLAAVRLLVA